MSYETLDVRFRESVCFLQIRRPEANNAINDRLVAECNAVLSLCETAATVVVLSGSPEVFCVGADFGALAESSARDLNRSERPAALYDLWVKLATGPYVTIAHVRGKANAGGIGFVAASDVVLADETAMFGLSELLFGLYPACVLPFLIRRIGFQRAHYLTLMTRPIAAARAYEWGLADAVGRDSEALLRQTLSRLGRLSKTAIRRYKSYMDRISRPLAELKSLAVAANVEVFADADNLAAISRYVEHGTFPWERP